MSPLGGPIMPQDVAQNVAHSAGGADKAFPICCVIVAGTIIAQGRVVEPLDVRGFIKSDMHGRVAIDVGGRIVVGYPIPSVRRGDA